MNVPVTGNSIDLTTITSRLCHLENTTNRVYKYINEY